MYQLVNCHRAVYANNTLSCMWHRKMQTRMQFKTLLVQYRVLLILHIRNPTATSFTCPFRSSLLSVVMESAHVRHAWIRFTKDSLTLFAFRSWIANSHKALCPPLIAKSHTNSDFPIRAASVRCMAIQDVLIPLRCLVCISSCR